MSHCEGNHMRRLSGLEGIILENFKNLNAFIFVICLEVLLFEMVGKKFASILEEMFLISKPCKF